MTDTSQIIFKLVGLFVSLFILYLLVAGSITLVLYTRIGQGDPKGFWYTDREKLKKYIFKSWIDWAGYPSTFSFKEQSDVFVSTVYKTLTSNVSVADCMLKCESANSRGQTPKCVGFTYATSNTCTLLSTMDGIISPSANTLYFIDGYDTAREYKGYPNKTQTDAAYVAGSPYTELSTGGPLECYANCAARLDCTGIIFTGTTGSTETCGITTNLDPNKFTADTTKTIAYLGPHGPLKAATISYY